MKRATAFATIVAFLAFAAAFLFVPAHRARTDEITLAMGEAVVLNADAGAVFSSDAPLIAGVSLSGEVLAITPGTSRITITERSGERQVLVTVEGVPVSHLSLSARELLLQQGSGITFSPLMNEDATDKRVIWKSTDPAVASVSQDGTVKAVSSGTATISVTAQNGLSAACEITVAQSNP